MESLFTLDSFADGCAGASGGAGGQRIEVTHSHKKRGYTRPSASEINSLGKNETEIQSLFLNVAVLDGSDCRLGAGRLRL